MDRRCSDDKSAHSHSRLLNALTATCGSKSVGGSTLPLHTQVPRHAYAFSLASRPVLIPRSTPDTQSAGSLPDPQPRSCPPGRSVAHLCCARKVHAACWILPDLQPLGLRLQQVLQHLHVDLHVRNRDRVGVERVVLGLGEDLRDRTWDHADGLRTGVAKRVGLSGACGRQGGGGSTRWSASAEQVGIC
eukprot:365445-Chlamydomonas_euryale.AAC.13